MNDGVDSCKICDNEFYVNKMVSGKCQLCHARFPNANNMDDVKKEQQQLSSKENDSSFENRMIKEVYKILENLSILVRCESCDELYYRRSPAQKGCGNCKNVFDFKGN